MPDQAHRESGEQGQCTDVTREGRGGKVAGLAMQDIGGTTLTAGIVSPRLLEIVHFIAQPQCGHCQPVRSTSSRCLHHGNYRDFSTHRQRGREAQTGNIYRIVFNYLGDMATFKHTV